MPQLNLQEQHSDPNTHSAIVPMITGSVEQQTLEGNVGTTNLGDNFASTSDASNLSQHEKKRVSRDKPEHFVHQVKAQKPQGTAYDVATLLELGKATDTTRVQLAFNKEVLAGKLLVFYILAPCILVSFVSLCKNISSVNSGVHSIKYL